MIKEKLYLAQSALMRLPSDCIKTGQHRISALQIVFELCQGKPGAFRPRIRNGFDRILASAAPDAFCGRNSRRGAQASILTLRIRTEELSHPAVFRIRSV